MISRRTTLALGAAAFAMPASAQGGDVVIIDNVELSGTGVTSGSMWRNGVDLAAKEINAAGGILGRKLAISHQDNQSQPQIAKAVATKAVDAGSYVLFGPIFSGNVNVSMPLAAEAETAMIMGGEAAALTMQGNQFLFRTSFSQANAMPKLAEYLKKSGIGSVAMIWVANDFGKGGRDTMAKELAARGIKVAADIPTDPGQMDFSAAVVNATQSNADALFCYTNEEESARLLIALRKLGYAKPIFGETVLISQRVIELAGGAANGVKGHVGLSVDAPNPAVQAFGKKFRDAYGMNSDHNGIKGYTAVYFVKAVTEKMGKFDRKGFAAALRGATLLAKDHPGILMDVTFAANGDIDRESYLVEVRDGRQVITEVLPPLGKK